MRRVISDYVTHMN